MLRSMLLVAVLTAPALLAGSPAVAAPDAPVPILAHGYTFLAPATTVPLGGAVEWTATLFGHTVTTADSLEDALAGVANEPAGGDADADTFDVELSRSEILPSYVHSFAEPGTYAYFCRLHHQVGMVGVVHVEEIPEA